MNTLQVLSGCANEPLLPDEAWLHAHHTRRMAAIEARLAMVVADRDRAVAVAKDLAEVVEGLQYKLAEEERRRKARKAKERHDGKAVERALAIKTEQLEVAARALQEAAESARDEAQALRKTASLARREADEWKRRCLYAESKLGWTALPTRPLLPAPAPEPEAARAPAAAAAVGAWERRYYDEVEARRKVEQELLVLRERTSSDLRVLQKALDDQIEANARMRMDMWTALADARTTAATPPASSS